MTITELKLSIGEKELSVLGSKILEICFCDYDNNNEIDINKQLDSDALGEIINHCSMSIPNEVYKKLTFE